MGSTFSPIALRKAKNVYSLDLSECNRVKVIGYLLVILQEQKYYTVNTFQIQNTTSSKKVMKWSKLQITKSNRDI